MSDLEYLSEDEGNVGDRTETAPQSARKDLVEKEKIVDKYQKLVNNDKVKTAKTLNDRANRATVDNVLDPRTIGFIKKIVNSGLITEMNGTISTGKEANVYRAFNSDTQKEFAIKIYKTSILVFKDRERYLDGEFRFRHFKNQHNPRKMIKLWAEKEFRNLKRLYTNGIPCPEPLELKSNVLVMEYLTEPNGETSPKLRDFPFESLEQLTFFYHQMLIYMRKMFHICRLVHADLSEYNSIIHHGKLYIIDVSQSVEPEHPMSLDFLRMDIKNINDYFQREGVIVHPEREIFKFVIEDLSKLNIVGSLSEDELDDEYFKYLRSLKVKDANYEEDMEDEVFRSIHLVRSLNHLDEQDFKEYSEGNINTLKQLSLDVVQDQDNLDDTSDDSTSSESEDSDDSEDSESEEKEWVEKPLRGKKHEDKEEKKDRKKEQKELAKEKRKTKVKKHVKKKLNKRRG